MRLFLLLLPLLGFGCEETVYRPGEPPKTVELSSQAVSAPPAAPPATVTARPATAAVAPAVTADTAAASTSSADPQTISDADLERYVTAFIKLQILEQRTQHRIDEAAKQGDQETIRRAAEEADVVARGILSESGINREEFVHLREQIQKDPELSARGKVMFERMLKEAGLKPGK